MESRKLLPDMTAKCTVNFKDNCDYLRYRLDNLRDDQRVYGKTRLNKLQWWSKTLKASATDSLVQHLLTQKGRSKERVLVCFGDGSLVEGNYNKKTFTFILIYSFVILLQVNDTVGIASRRTRS